MRSAVPPGSQVDMVVGKEADPEFVEKVHEVATNHSPYMTLDTVPCAWRSGSLRFRLIPFPQFKYPGPKSVFYTPYKTFFDTLGSVYETF